MSRDVPPALRALLETGGALVRRSSSGRIALARAAPVVPADALPRGLEGLAGRLADARERSLEPIAFKAVERALKDAWGKPPGKVLDDLEREPLAVTPAAQVHRGEVDGEAVAVKVLRPGLALAIRGDLALLDALAGPLGAVLGSADAGTLLREARESALDELDLEHEAGQQRQVRRALREIEEEVVIPRPHSELAGESVIVTELLDGPTLETRAPEDPGRVARALVRAHLEAWSRAGLVLTDPRPSHVVLLADGRVGLLGTGVARAVPRERADSALELLRALRAEDATAFTEALRELGLLPTAAAADAFTQARHAAGPLVSGPATLDGPALAAVGDRALRRIGPWLTLAAQATPQPHDLPVARMAGQLAALLSRIGATEDWARLAAP